MVVNDKFCDVLDDLIAGNFLDDEEEVVFDEISGIVAELTIFRG